ncbi:hypothetical protein NQ315_001072 [Exocentrus adspersus]|uniref:Cilia- and flagella-associated protein 299 n=1 Tax=Exocentrus adspersus TaxID=1586481 RepID=A0AAV8WFI8_9CUCU|nr:hypothetical protein NQ315_001072 [Exocentrus adspersus]
MAQVIPYNASPQIEADRRLLQFSNYEQYLDSLNTAQDDCYLGSVEARRHIAELGAVLLYLYPPYKPYELSSEGMKGGDPLQLELALRERSNRVGILSTIIFLRQYNKMGFEISGYIDYGDKLRKEDWKPFFRGTKKIIPKSWDLGFYHWRAGKVVSNDSLNYKVLMHPTKGLIFLNRFDRKVINPAPDTSPGANTTRKRVYTSMYELVILFDHVVRQRI